jgi:hypothetical protein
VQPEPIQAGLIDADDLHRLAAPAFSLRALRRQQAPHFLRVARRHREARQLRAVRSYIVSTNFLLLSSNEISSVPVSDLVAVG